MLVWARAFVYARRHELQILAPQWFQIRLGPIIRHEPAKRFYVREFTNAGYIGGFRKRLILLRSYRVPELDSGSLPSVAFRFCGRPIVIEFNGLRNYFADLISHRQLIASELRRIVSSTVLQRASSICGPFIVANVRRGDMTRQRIPVHEILQYTPLDWFISAIEALRHHDYWGSLPIKVVSDGSLDELRGLLSLPGCELVSTGKAIGDILMMSRASLLLASGYSTFSMWASFLGQMPTLYAPRKMQQRLFDVDSMSFEGEWSPGDVLPELSSYKAQLRESND